MTIENHVRLYEVLRVCMRDNRCNDAKKKLNFTNQYYFKPKNQKQIMKKNHFLKASCAFLLLSVGLLLASCAQDGFDDETFKGTYSGFDMDSPDASTIMVKASSDKLSQTISWQPVEGAGTYTVSVYEGENRENVVVENEKVKVSQITVPRIDKTYYYVTILTDDNGPEGNTGSTTPTEYSWSTFTIEVGTIPAGVDLYEWFDNNPIPVSYEATDITYRLEAGQEYTMSNLLKLGNNIVTFRPTDDEGRVSIKYTGDRAGFETSSGLTLRNIDFDCAGSAAAFIAMSKEPAIAPIIVNAWSTDWNFYCATEPISVINCNIENLESYFFYDNKVQCWFPTSVLVDNCLVHLTTSKTSDMGQTSNAGYFWTNKGSGYIRELTVRNSTFYNTGEVDAKYFVQYGGFGWSQTNESLGWVDNTITYENSTFYHVCSSGQWGNYNGTAGKSTSFWNMKNCIFYDCSSSGVARRFLAGKQNQATATFENNTYMKKDGSFDDPTNYDNSGTDIKEDPQFANPESGDFHISGPTQVSLRTGDPRWLP